MKISEALDVRNRSVSFREAEIFLQEIVNVPRSYLLTHPEEELNSSQEMAFQAMLMRRETNEPVAYITGHKEFYSRIFKTDRRALIPRPETEGLIDRSVEWAVTYFQQKVKETNKPCLLHVLELGTGSGNIAITLILELAQRGIPIDLIATDISEEALNLAQENWDILGKLNPPRFSSINFIQANLFKSDTIQKDKPFDLIVANLPYVPTAWQFDPVAQPEVVFQEPDIALFGGEDGLIHYRTFFSEATNYLKEKGAIFIEYGEDETAAIQNMAQRAFKSKTATVYKDYADLDRILAIT